MESSQKDRTLHWLYDLLARTPTGTRLPDNTELCRILGISRQTAQDAYAILAREGAVTRLRRVGTFAGVRGTPPLSTFRMNEKDLADRLLADIRVGRHRPGEALPSIGALAEAHGVSRAKVSTALKRLVAWRIIHRHGKRYLAGWEGGDKHRLSTAAFITVTTGTHTNLPVMGHPFAGLFYMSLFKELQKSAVSLRRHVIQRYRNDSLPSNRIEDLERQIALGKHRVIGLLMHPSRWPRAHHEELMQRLDRFDQPLILYRHENSDLPALTLHNLLQIRSLESSMCRCLAETLADTGFRRVAFVSMDNAPWARHRHTVLQAAFRESVPNGSVAYWGPGEIGLDPQKEFPILSVSRWKGPGGMAPRDRKIISRRFEKAHRELPPFLRRLMDLAPGFSKIAWSARLQLYTSLYLALLIRYPDTEALVFSNDAMASLFEPFWHDHAWRVPEEISLFSFDNDPRYFTSLPCTVDRGLESAGYQTARFLLRDRTTAMHPGMTYDARPFLALRAGLGMPRQGPLRRIRGMERLLAE